MIPHKAAGWANAKNTLGSLRPQKILEYAAGLCEHYLTTYRARIDTVVKSGGKFLYNVVHDMTVLLQCSVMASQQYISQSAIGRNEYMMVCNYTDDYYLFCMMELKEITLEECSGN